MATILGLIVLYVLWKVLFGNIFGRFVIGIIFKFIYSSIAFAICMAIPIPIINFLLAIYIICAIWGSPVE